MRCRRRSVPMVVAGCALVLGIAAPAASADPVVHVNNSLDTGSGSLRQAMADVDAGGEIVFDAGADPVLDSQILINQDVTISGLGAGTTTITGDSNDRIFALSSNVTVTIRDLELTGGNAPDGGTGGSPGATGDPGGSGGAISNPNTTSSLTLRRTLIDGNSAGTGGDGGAGDMDNNGGPGGAGGRGGAIYSDGTLEIEDSRISDNQAGDAGAPGVNGGSATTGPNGATGGGGGAINASHDLTISGSTIDGN